MKDLSSVQIIKIRSELKNTLHGLFVPMISRLSYGCVFSLVIIFFSENCTIFDVQVKFKTNLTSELDASLTTAVESVRQSGVQFQGQKYAITETPVISVPYGKTSSTLPNSPN